MSVMPEVDIWLVCDECETAWVLRRNLLDGEWLWMRDCKHKKATWTAHDATGPLEANIGEPATDAVHGGET